LLKNSSKISHYLSNLWTNISGIKQIVYPPKKFGIHHYSFRFASFSTESFLRRWILLLFTRHWQGSAISNGTEP